MATTRVPAYIELENFTQTEETSFAVTLTGKTSGCVVTIFNTTLNVKRFWNGTAFESFPAIPPLQIPLATITAQGAVTATGTPSGKFLKDDLTWGSPAGGGSFTITETEIDFGSVPLKMKRFTITDAAVTASHKILVTLSYNDPSDGDLDSAEWFENMTVMARAGTGQFFLYANSPYQDLNGKVKVNYTFA